MTCETLCEPGRRASDDLRRAASRMCAAQSAQASNAPDSTCLVAFKRAPQAPTATDDRREGGHCSPPIPSIALLQMRAAIPVS